MTDPFWLYLHGFASSPQSAKAQYLSDRCTEQGHPLTILDLNQNDFTHLTLSRQLTQAAASFPPDRPVTVIGSSLGGLTAAWLAQQQPQVERLILLAPAFGFLNHWLARLGEDAIAQWHSTGFHPVYHYGAQREIPLHDDFLTDAEAYEHLAALTRPIPTLILHGIHDDVIPVAASRDYAQSRPWVKLIELDSDHLLAHVMPEIWEAVRSFCRG
ncbi:YqiA/YcfP family alpha/beta fold hydrolase [Spirulina major]|uniref:YqiA/YcfP family alpha/beta fold hydrolase n=1 Tax=Spirulina major TaxID=270636 RepID=UPI00093406C9|nr:YqiA/YcfP family alpha/beta fold hydrolase [Spirulina major]